MDGKNREDTLNDINETVEETNELTDNEAQVKCPSCGGFMTYSPASGNLKCVYCGSEKELDKTPVEMTGHLLEDWREVTEEEQTHKSIDIKCEQCGATTTLSGNIASSRCPFCGSPLVNSNVKTRNCYEAEYILPFSFDKKNCKSAYKKWLSGKWFAPSRLKKEAADPASFQGVYLPFWGYDANTETFYRGQRGETRTRTVRRNGRVETESYTVWYDMSGYVYLDFNNLLVSASDTIPDSILDNIRDWNLKACVPYNKNFVSGFTSEIYQHDFKECYPKAQRRMDGMIDNKIRCDIGGSMQRILSKDTDYQNVAFKYCLLPVWISSFKYDNKLYRFVINGYSGEVVGEYPKSKWKIAFVIFCIVAAISVFYYCFLQ